MAQYTFKVEIIESESGWGQRTDEIKSFDSFDEADRFIKKYNSKNNLAQTPSWYMYARAANFTPTQP